MGPGFDPYDLRKKLANIPNIQEGIKQMMKYEIPNCHVITLMVDSSRITQEEIDEHCHFVHLDHGFFKGQGMPSWVQESGSNENYTLKVVPKDKIIWAGITPATIYKFAPKPGDDIIKITEIDYESGQNLFGPKDLKAKTSESCVEGNVRDDVSEVDAMEYTIKFEVYNGNKLRGKYSIDPKISIKPKQ